MPGLGVQSVEKFSWVMRDGSQIFGHTAIGGLFFCRHTFKAGDFRVDMIPTGAVFCVKLCLGFENFNVVKSAGQNEIALMVFAMHEYI